MHTVPVEAEDETGRRPTGVGFGMRVSQCFGSLFEKEKEKQYFRLLILVRAYQSVNSVLSQ